MAEPLLKLENVSATYGPIHALKGIDLDVSNGEIVALIGPNGAGKTTLLRSVLGVHLATRGVVRFDGEDLSGKRSHERIRRGLVLVPEGRGILPSMSVAENLLMGAYARPDRNQAGKEITSVYERFPILGERRDQMAGTLSGGQQQMLALGRALVAKPRLLMLDEPSLGLAPMVVKEVFQTIRELNGGGLTILLIEQNARMALALASRAYLLETGSIVLSGDTEEIKSDSRVRAAYLGA
jgi:branched-chain amino acid transport system ATP-binding protein